MRPAWHDKAACRDEDPDLLFPLVPTPEAATEAAAVCARCPVQAKCRHAGDDEPHGVWGGASEYERRAGRRRRTAAA